jgi:hypothetical protein
VAEIRAQADPLWYESHEGTVGRGPGVEASTCDRSFASLQRLLIDVDLYAVERFLQVLRRPRDRRSMVFIAGNGGQCVEPKHGGFRISAKARRKVHLQAKHN